MSLASKLVEPVLLSVLVALFGTLVWKYLRTIVRFVYLTSKIPGPSLWVILTSHAKGLMSDDLLNILCQLSASFDHKPWGLWTLGEYMIFVSDSETVSEIYKNKHLTDKADKFYDLLRFYVGRGLFTLNGTEYKQHRRIIRPVFRKNFVEYRFQRINQQAMALIERLYQISTGENVDIRSTIDDYAYAASISTFTSDMSSINRNEVLEVTNAANDLIKLGSKNPLYYWIGRKLKTSIRQTESMIKTRKAFFKDFLLEEKRQAEARMDAIGNEPINIPECIVRRNSEVGQSLKDDEYFEEALLLITAAGETTTTALNITLLLLALHLDIQERIFEEMESIFGGTGRQVELVDLSRMTFLELVIKESFRIFPPGPMLLRKVKEETTINGTVLPKGATLGINVLALHRNPNSFEDPLKFDPNRFLPEATKNRHPCAYIPFGYGLRDCPAQIQAHTVMKTTLCLIVRNFKILPGDTLRSINDIKVTVATTGRLCGSSLRFIKRKENCEIS